MRITGVGFFDFIHGQRGVAPNGIELHPVLSVEFLQESPDGENRMPRLPLPPKPLTVQPPDGPFATTENVQEWYAWVAGAVARGEISPRRGATVMKGVRAIERTMKAKKPQSRKKLKPRGAA